MCLSDPCSYLLYLLALKKQLPFLILNQSVGKFSNPINSEILENVSRMTVCISTPKGKFFSTKCTLQLHHYMLHEHQAVCLIHS